ncbi:MAG: acetate--CoA ligase family protein [Anaerolineales bacterium]|nr:acetate--CoA ligase family protein [Anaerolineales bacterium]
MDHSLTPFFNPQGVVVIGASSKPDKLGYGVARNLSRSGYQGNIYFVNPGGGKIFNRSMYTSLMKVPDPVDLAVLIIPAAAAPETIKLCGQRGIRAVILLSSGFRETGPGGAELENKCLEIARRHNIRMIGPNCIGLLDTHLPLDTSFLQTPLPRKGNIALISHSGAVCAALIDWSLVQNFGFSHLVSLGNQADINETDILSMVVEDPNTEVLALYLECIQDGRRFLETAGAAARKKPVIVLKSGRSEAGQKAAASHTGALAGSEIAYTAAFSRAGVLRAGTIEEMFDWARFLAWGKKIEGRNIAILTNSGGPGVLATDALGNENLELAQFTMQTKTALEKRLPPAASIRNPVDLIASGSPEQYATCLNILLEDPGVNGAMVILVPPPMYAAIDVARSLIPVIQDSKKPVGVALIGGKRILKARQLFKEANIPEYPFPESAISSLARLADRADYLRQPHHSPTRPADINVDRAQQIVEQAASDAWLPAQELETLLEAYKIPVSPIKLASTPEEAAHIAAGMGFPVVLKIASPDLQHKSDVGGIILNIRDEEQTRCGFTQMIERVSAQIPEAHLDGIHVQRMLPKGQEVISGVIRDKQFGPLVMFGSGGVEVEGLQDVAFELAPLTEHQSEVLINRTWAGKKLSGFRSIPAADKQAASDILVRLAWLACDCPAISEIEINPLLVMAPGQGVSAVDVRVRISESNTSGPC